MYNILFSIPVHESPETIIDQIINYITFNNNCAIVLHFSHSFTYEGSIYNEETFKQILAKFKQVLINPNHLRTGYADIIQAHISNFLFAENIIEFNYFSIGASNDLFIKSGLENLISLYDAGLNEINVIEDSNWMWRKQCLEDKDLLVMLNRYGANQSNIVRCQIEGCFYKKEIFKKIANEISETYFYEKYDFKGKDKNKIYPREEVYFSSLIRLLYPHINIFPSCYAYVAFEIRKSHIPKISSICRYAKDTSYIYNVKRITRKLNDPFRAFIRKDIGKYYEREKAIIKNTRKCNYLILYMWNLGIIINNSKIAYFIRKKIRKILKF